MVWIGLSWILCVENRTKRRRKVKRDTRQRTLLTLFLPVYSQRPSPRTRREPDARLVPLDVRAAGSGRHRAADHSPLCRRLAEPGPGRRAVLAAARALARRLPVRHHRLHPHRPLPQVPQGRHVAAQRRHRPRWRWPLRVRDQRCWFDRSREARLEGPGLSYRYLNQNERIISNASKHLSSLLEQADVNGQCEMMRRVAGDRQGPSHRSEYDMMCETITWYTAMKYSFVLK